MVQKQISYESSDKELIKATWKPTWELEKTKNKWPKFWKYVLDFEALWDEPDLTVPSADETMSSLERQGFAMEIIYNTWKNRLDTPLLCTLTQRDTSLPATTTSPLVLPKAYTSKMACIYDVAWRGRKMQRHAHSGTFEHPLQSISWHQTCWTPWYHHASPQNLSLFPTRSSPHLVKKVPDWKEWTQTDVSC